MISLPQPWPTNPWPSQFRTVRASEEGLSPGLQFLTIQSPRLRGRGDLALFVPPDMDSATDVPVAVLLHGVYGSFWNWAFNGCAHIVLRELLATGEVAPMVLAMPSDGMAGEGTAYLPHPNADYEQWIIDEVPAAVRESVSCVGSDSPLMLGGNSMGGYGAIRLGARHHDRIAAVAAHSPITHLDELALFTERDVGTTAGLPRNERALLDVIEVIDAKGAALPPLFVDCGTADPLIDVNRALRDGLERRGVALTYEEYAGGHDWASWRRRIGMSLRFFDRVARRII